LKVVAGDGQGSTGIQFFNGSAGSPDANRTENSVSQNGYQGTLGEAVRGSIAVTLTGKDNAPIPYVVLGTDYYNDPTVSQADTLLHEVLHVALGLGGPGDKDLKNYLTGYGFQAGYGHTGGTDDITEWLKADCPDLRKK
jgi:hypothetical protein